MAALVALGWSDWDSSWGTPYRPRNFSSPPAVVGSWDALDDLRAAQAADTVYASDALAAAMEAQLAVLAAPRSSFLGYPAFKPRLWGLLSTPQGVRYATIFLDTGASHATHCFICAALGLPPSGQPGPLSATMASVGGAQGLGSQSWSTSAWGTASRCPSLRWI